MAKARRKEGERESLTDWARVMADEQARRPVIVDDDDTQTTAQEVAAAVHRYRGQRGRQRLVTKEAVSLRLDVPVLQYFREAGRGWQTRINDVLAVIVSGKPMPKAVQKVLTARSSAAKAGAAKMTKQSAVKAARSAVKHTQHPASGKRRRAA